MDKEKAKIEIEKLVNLYNKYKEDKILMSNERQACDSLIRPFFHKVLGWNIEDPYEFKSEYGLGGKRIDYLACIEGVSQFVIEAKAPSIDINDKTDFYKQAVQYAEAKDKDFAILTNFNTFIILRAGIEVGGIYGNVIKTIDLLKFTESDLEFLLNFSKNFWVEKGDENPLYSQKNLKKKSPLDQRLVEEMTTWREHFLRSLNRYKEKYNFSDEKELERIEEEVQRFIDRLIFICYCEDKQLNDNKLKPLLKEYRKNHVGKVFLMPNIKKLFEEYRRIYNSDLFKEGLCDEFEFDEGILSEVFENLRGYFGETLPYDFSIIDADILGRAYENFLGHIITGKSRFKEKKDIGKRKKMGIYYTPQYIVNYIVKNTVIEKIKNLKFEEILKIKIVDPACGSGSFLIKAFDVLMEESKIKLGRDLEYDEKKNLLLNCIHGVDLDERACDIAKLNLSLKLATRGEKLPSLHENIRNGNSLIEDEKISKDKAFNWGGKFPFKFDVVIGNPPYVSIDPKLKKISLEEFSFIKENYQSFMGQTDLYVFFYELGYKILKEDGVLGFISKNRWTNSPMYKNYRIFLSDKNVKIIDFDERFIFEGVGTTTNIIFLKKDKIKNVNYYLFNNSKKDVLNFENYKIFKNKKVDGEKWNIFSDEITEKIIKEGENILYGGCGHKITPSKYFLLIKKDGNYFPESKEIRKKISLLKINDFEESFIKNFASSGDLFPYNIKNERYIIYPDNINLNETPNLKKYFNLIKESKYGSKWYEYHGGKGYRNVEILKSDKKIIFPGKMYLNRGPSFNLVGENFQIGMDCEVLKSKKEMSMKYLLGVLNSNLMWYFYRRNFKRYASRQTIDSKKIPIKIPNQIQEKEIEILVDKIVFLNRELSKIGEKDKYKKENIEEEVKIIRNEIDQEIYKLYNLTSEEINLVESNLG